MTDLRALKVVLSNLAYFSSLVLRLPLYDYQLRPALAVVDSVLHRQGREFLFIFPRQSGKNEAVAQLLVYLLNILQRRGGHIVYGATGDGLGRGILRLEARLDNPLNRSYWSKSTRPARRSLGKASVVFLSTHPSAATRGETADWLLVVDELQDQVASHIEAVFEPMRAANNATALYIGTVKTTADALWQKKMELSAEQAKDGFQRVYIVTPEEVVNDNPAYGRFLENKIHRLGRHHPIVASEYFNEPVAGAGGLFDHRRQQLMRGDHFRQTAPDPAAIYVATLDVGGLDEATTDPLAQLANPGRDYTVAHIFEVGDSGDSEPGPTYKAVDIFVDQGSRHFQDIPGRPKLAERLLAWLRHWDVHHLVADQSGIGAGLVDWLAAKLGPDKVTGFTFTSPAKAALGAGFLSLVETGRFRYWQAESPQPLSDEWWFFTQVQACTYALPPGARFEKDLRWSVPPGTKIDTPAGPQPIHDDRLISAALVAVYDDLYREGALILGRAESAIIPPYDPLADIGFDG